LWQRLKPRGGKIAQTGLVCDEPFADRPLKAAGTFILTGAATFGEPLARNQSKAGSREREAFSGPLLGIGIGRLLGDRAG
jgi:hypothetical protein